MISNSAFIRETTQLITRKAMTYQKMGVEPCEDNIPFATEIQNKYTNKLVISSDLLHYVPK
jgi:hypothetical protein